VWVDPPLLAEPRSRRTLLFVTLGVVLALVAGGVLAYRTSRDTTHEIPALVGMERGVALNMVSEFGWQVSAVDETSEDVEPGIVIRTDPVAGERLDEGDSFSIIVSTGPAPRVLPELAGLTVDEATASLDDLGLVIAVGEQPFDEIVPIGTVIDWSVADQPGLVAGDSVVRGTSVTVRVSAGPAPRVVPDLTNLPLEQATSVLATQQLTIAQAPDEFSATVAIGLVVRQDPAVGTSVPPGTTISVVLSKGPDLVVVPPLANLTLAEAAPLLEAAGLTVGRVSGNPIGGAVRAEANGQVLAEGVLLPRGTPIDLTFA
jgi:eukaryotic-like serine/threonine-protein kinase